MSRPQCSAERRETLRVLLLTIFLVMGLVLSRPFSIDSTGHPLFLLFQIVAIIVLSLASGAPARAHATSPFLLPSLLFVLSMVCSNALHGKAFALDYRTINWLTAPLLLAALTPFSPAAVRRALLLALPAYLCVNFFVTENENIYAAAVLGMFVFTAGSYSRLAALCGAFFIGLLLAYVKTAVGALVSAVLLSYWAMLEKLKIKHKTLPLLLIPLSYFSFVYAGSTWGLYNVHSRDQSIMRGIEQFFTNPFIGTGTGGYLELYNPYFIKMIHAHCFPVTVLAETGLLGFAALAFFCFTLSKQWKNLPLQSRMVIALYAFWSLLEEPLQWWGTLMIFILALTQRESPETVPAARA